MRLSVWPDAMRPFEQIRDVAVWCDEQGWDRLYLADHFMPDGSPGMPDDGPNVECFTTLAALAGPTSRIGLGSLVAAMPYRHPAVLANIAATLSVVSDGRVVLGIGAGWQANELDAYGIELGTVTERLDRLDEGARVIRSLLTRERTTFEGRHYRLTDAPCEPEPVAPLPLLIGGKGERRTMRIAAELADEWNAWCTPEQMAHKTGVLDRHCEDIGRDPSTIQRSTQAFVVVGDGPSPADQPPWIANRPWIAGSVGEVREQLGAFVAAGADELIVPIWHLGGTGEAIDHLGRVKDAAADLLGR